MYACSIMPRMIICGIHSNARCKTDFQDFMDYLDSLSDLPLLKKTADRPNYTGLVKNTKANDCGTLYWNYAQMFTNVNE